MSQLDIVNADHLFCDSSILGKVWDIAIACRWLTKSYFSSPSMVINEELLTLLWSIYKARNSIVFNNNIFSPLRTIITAKQS